ncbi:MAG: adenylate cyclase [Verrucomicrobiota bacterium]
MLPPTTLARLRSTSGLVIGLYVTMHLSNHALGLISIQAQETARPWVMALWHSLPGQILLYGSLATHAFCGLAALARRRHYRMPAWEAFQIFLGLAIPYLLLVHIVNTRGTRILTGIDINYPYEIANLWVDPWTRYRQILLVVLVWGHFAVGLHFWLRIRAWYRRVFPAIVLAYVLIPTGALLGFAEVGMTTNAHAQSDPAWFKRMKTLGVPADPNRAAIRKQLKDWAGYSWLVLVGVVICAAQIRNWRRRDEIFTVTYPGDDVVEAPIGLSVLEVSRMVRRPHVSVCGGRARCTTCRIRIDETAEELPMPNDLEAQALARIGAPTGVRLACQLRPQNDVTVYPLLHPDLSIRSRSLPGKEFGEERRVTILFIDLRGSTSLAEGRLPYDVVFVLNHYFAEMAAAVEASGGHYSNFTGDGLMALFGLEASDDYGARAALNCAVRMLESMDRLNQQLVSELAEPLAMGIGIHTGEGIIGQMGPPKTPVLTALGDAVNTAARLESATKELQTPVVVSRDTLKAAQLWSDELDVHNILLRGRSVELAVAALDKNTLAHLLGALSGV